MGEEEKPILYVLVIGFHHKKGCQVEFSFPPLVPDAPNECPAGWKYLPTLALPDGSHNFEEDSIFFHLPSLTNAKQTVYGISCFRQIPVEEVKNLTADITRGSVQKSVCVLSRVPLYGQIQVKIRLITQAYFEKGDFNEVAILEDAYQHLNAVLLQNDFVHQMFVGLSARDFVLQWKHKSLLLFKLLLLEKRVMFFKSPVHPLCSTILTLISLFPEMIESGLQESACIRLSRPMSPMPEYSDEDRTPSPLETTKNGAEPPLEATAKPESETATEEEPQASNDLNRDVSSDSIADGVQSTINYLLSQITVKSCGFPLSIFTKGSLCLPYLSLPYLGLLKDVNVRSYVVGATNILFKQKRQLYDILVDIDANRIECQDLNLRKLLHLTTEDLRFVDYVVRRVSEGSKDVFLDGVGWEGGDEWVRLQFRIYLLSLLRTSLLPDGQREIDWFNASFLSSWRDTHNYKIWLGGVSPMKNGEQPGIWDIHPGHPFAGQLSVSDMKLRLTHTMYNTVGVKKINQAMVSTGRAVATTSKAVGGTLSQARGAVSSWFSNLLIAPEVGQKVEEEPDGSQDTEDQQDPGKIHTV